MKIRYSRRATRDLEAIHEYLIHRSPKGATNVLTAIYASMEFIRRHPEATQATTVPGVHGMIVRRYHFKIFYRILEADSVIEIIHVRHTSRHSWPGEDR